MEEAKAAAYYEELTRKGEGAARFKQGLGFSTTTSSSVPCSPKPSSSSSSPFSNFIRASSPGKAEKQAQLETIQAKLRRPRRSPSPDLRCQGRERDVSARRRSTSKERQRERDRDRRSLSRDRRRSSRSYSSSEEDRVERRQSRSGRKERDNFRLGNRSRSPFRISSFRDLKRDHERSSRHRISEEKSDKLDYPRLIEGYSQMAPAERVKAKMKLQLSQTAANDSTMAMSNGWERFDFNKNAPLDDDDDEIEVAGDDASLVKKIGSSFRFSAVQAKREEEIKAAHDEAMFGASAPEPIVPESKGDDDDDTKLFNNEKQGNNLLISDKVLEKQQGSWRDRVGRFKSGFDS